LKAIFFDKREESNKLYNLQGGSLLLRENHKNLGKNWPPFIEQAHLWVRA
jgi:hypothetical protein